MVYIVIFNINWKLSRHIPSSYKYKMYFFIPGLKKKSTKIQIIKILITRKLVYMEMGMI